MKNFKQISPNRSYYSTQISSRHSPKKEIIYGQKPKDIINKAKSNIEFLSTEVRKYKRECTELEGELDLTKKHGENLSTKVGQLRQQLEMILAQNEKLQNAKTELVSHVTKTIKDKQKLDKTKQNIKEAEKQKMINLQKQAEIAEKRHKKKMLELENKIYEQNNIKSLLEEKIEKAKEEIRDLERKKKEKTTESRKLNEEFVQEVDILSHIISVS